MLNLWITILLLFPNTSLDIKDYARLEVMDRYQSKSEWKCFKQIIYIESRWIPNLENGRYYGLGQQYDGKRYLEGKPRKQIRAALKYIEGRYGTPCKALGHHLERGWY